MLNDKTAYRLKSEFGPFKKDDLFIGPYPTMESPCRVSWYHQKSINDVPNSMNLYEYYMKERPELFEYLGKYNL